MGKQSMAAKDIFMNLAGIRTDLDAADSSTLVEVKLNTGLSIRGGLIWLIHKLEWFARSAEADYEILLALSTRQGLGSIPSLTDDGVIGYMRERGMLTTSGFPIVQRPLIEDFLPPIPIATPELSLYGRTLADVATLQGAEIMVRIGFTTAQLDAAAYTEVAETWGW